MDTISNDLGLEDSFGAEEAELEQEISGLRIAVNGTERCDEGADEGVEELEKMMLKMQAIKDMGAQMPGSDRRKLAVSAVRDIMKAP